MSEKDEFKNKAEEYKGRTKEGLGKATGNEQWQAEGKKEKSTSKLKQAGEKLKDAVTPDKKPGEH
ncbi:CsbD-like protein [Nocardiopsis sp. Huas11]|uniref:CsbD family protein n=1 Tax=Nocardiopsis sp. Huas11 TaxID=2183912 RepID=UPI000EB42EE3|nr:CsbD family protein [Nocardiopsis sp. Huas11]RKS07341.1 CsbD-like protein [Nocardiopsis sp. Huas11]